MINPIFSNSYGTGLASLTPKNREAGNSEDAKLKDTCMEFEAVMTTMMFKEGLKSAQEAGFTAEGEDDRDGGTKQYMEFINEQMAYNLGKQGMLGLGEQIYNSVRERIKNSVSTGIEKQGGTDK